MKIKDLSIDGIKPPAKNRTEDFVRWMNWIESQMRTMPYYSKTKINVRFAK